MPTLFERIVAGEIPCHRVWEDSHHLAFLDINPRCVGHTLVIPKLAESYLFALSPERFGALWSAAREVAGILEQKLKARRVCVAVHGWEVPHVHVHLFPTHTVHDVPFPPVDPEALASLAQTAHRLAPTHPKHP